MSESGGGGSGSEGVVGRAVEGHKRMKVGKGMVMREWGQRAWKGGNEMGGWRWPQGSRGQGEEGEQEGVANLALCPCATN